MTVIVLAAAFLAMIYFAGTETALLSLSPFNRNEILKGKRKASAGALRGFIKSPHRVLTAILIGNALAVVVASVAVQTIAIKTAEKTGYNISIVSGILSFTLFIFVVFFGDILPKTAARKNPQKFSLIYLHILSKFTIILSPVSAFLFFISRSLFSFIGVHLSKTLPRTSSQEFADVAEIAFLSGRISKEEKRMIRGILDFPNKEVRQVMVPEVEIEAVDIEWGKDEIMRKIAGYNHSRIPVYHGSLDNIVGLIYTKDVMGVLSFSSLLIMQDIIRTPTFVPETAPVGTLLKKFKEGRQHMSVVVDEYGKVTGIITLEDILEEVTGDIFDEFDRETRYKNEKDGSYIVPAYEDVDRVNAKLGLHLPSDPAESIGGLVIEHLNYLPKKGECVKVGDVILEVESADRQKIKTVRIKKT